MTSSLKTSYHHGALRPALISVAREILDEGGPDAVGLRETARRVGVSATATYRHFLDKEILLAAVATEGFQEFGQALRDSMKDGAPFSAMGRAYVNFARKHPGLFRLMFSPLLRQTEKFPDLAAAAAAALDFGAPRAESFKASPEESTMTAFLSAWAMVHGLAYLVLEGVPPFHEDPSPYLEQIFSRPAPNPSQGKATSSQGS